MTKYCPSCGEPLVDNAKFCKNCGHDMENINPQNDTNQQENITPSQQYQPPVVENDHKIAVIIGYVLAILIPLFGVITGIYLITRKDSENAKKHGKYVIIVAILIWIISFVTLMH